MAFANPSPLALFGFAFPTILLSICNAGIFKMNAALLGLAIAHGGLSQLVVGILLFFKGSTFGHVVFFSYGAFWWSVAILVAMPGIAPESFAKPTDPFMGAFFLLWGIFSFFCWFCTFRQNRVVFLTFLALWPTFVLLSVSHWNGDAGTLKAGGWLGLICGCLAFYLGMAELVNETVGSVLLPIGDPKNVERERAFLRNWANQLRGREPDEGGSLGCEVGTVKRDSDVEQGVTAGAVVLLNRPDTVAQGMTVRKCPSATLG
uniref:GPR1/FUN34/yaaH family protein n=1 Tax=Cryptomonas curvata TaxID=233186 RepID=A0A7S0QCQ6_9CRYP